MAIGGQEQADLRQLERVPSAAIGGQRAETQGVKRKPAAEAAAQVRKKPAGRQPADSDLRYQGIGNGRFRLFAKTSSKEARTVTPASEAPADNSAANKDPSRHLHFSCVLFVFSHIG